MEKHAKDVPVKSVRKALTILNVLVFEDLEGRGFSLSELAERMEMPANSAHNLLKSMAACGYVGQIEGGRYTAGPVCADIGRLNLFGTAGVSAVVEAKLSALTQSIQEASVFATLVDGQRLVIRTVDAQQAITINHAMLQRDNDIYARPTGRVLVAYASDHERERVLARHGFPGSRWDGIESEQALADACSALRAHAAYTLIPDHNGIAAFACPVFDSRRTLQGALGCYAPMFRCPEDAQQRITEAMLTTAADLGKALSAQ